MRPTKILVTGATGFIGSRLCELLSLEHRLPYRALVRDFSRAARIGRLGAEMIAGDMLEPASLARAVDGCDTVVNLAHSDDRTAAKQTAHLVDACVRAGVRRLIHISSMAVYGPSPMLPVITENTAPIKRWGEAYSDAKAAAEEVVSSAAKRSLETVILRPTIVYGPYSFFVTPIVQEARQGRISLIDGGRGICNAVYVDDVCEAITAALDRDDAVGAAVQINGDERITWLQFISAFADLVECEKSTCDYSPEEIAAHWAARRPRVRDNFTAAIRLAASPAFHAQLGTIPAVGKLIRGAKELLDRRMTPEQKMMLKYRFQGRSADGSRAASSRPAPVPSEGRVVREAYRSWLTNDLAKARLGWAPAHPFALGVRRTGEWLRFARLV